MVDRAVEDDIAFIRNALEDGRAYARGRSADLLVWGLFVTTGYLATYAFVRGWSPVDPNWVWAVCILSPWTYSLRRAAWRLLGRAEAAPPRSPMARALSMLWLGCGIFLVTLAFAANWTGAVREHWFDGVVAGVMGVAFFGGSFLCNLSWMRWVAFAWWAGEILLFALRNSPAILPVAALMMLVLLAGPGLVLLAGGRKAG